MKDLLDRYLAAVARQLPDRQRADIVAELRDELLTTVELREEAAGRPLTRDELEAVLLEFGHPLIIAGRYRKVQHVVGPDVFPFWWAGLKVTLGIVAAIYLVVAILHAAFGDTGPLIDDEFPSLVPTLLTAFGAVTLVAVVIERLNLQRFVYRWQPRQLPPTGVKSSTPFERVVEIGMEVVFILWWTHVIHFRNWIPGGYITVDLAPVFQTWFWPILAYSSYEIVMNVIGLVQPGRVRLNAGLSLMRSLAAMVIVGGLLQADHWLIVTSTYEPSVGESVQANFDLGFKVGLVATFAGMAIKAAMDVRRLWRMTQDAKSPLLLSVL